jgi:hypothetical protein
MACKFKKLFDPSSAANNGRFVAATNFLHYQTILAGTWLLEELRRSATEPNSMSESATRACSDMSGVETISLVPADTPLTINGIGEVRTSWIGQKGVCI